MADRITLVGAGLVGSLLAKYLGNRGYQVDMYEKRPDMRKQLVDRGRSINLAVSVRGLTALAGVGLKERALSESIPMRGRQIHLVDGTQLFQPYGRDPSECIYSTSRGGLNALLMEEAEKTGNVKIHFDSPVYGMDFEGGTLKLDGGPVKADVVIGTDGASSAIRRQMAERLDYENQESFLEYGYKELLMPASAAGGFSMEKNALHIWPRQSFMLIALPNFDGSFTCTLFLPTRGEVSFEAIEKRKSLEAMFLKWFSDFIPLCPDYPEQFYANPTGSLVTVRSSPWNVGGKALLLGDASHAIVPFFGQGMNAGFEDVAFLDKLLEEGDWEKIFPHFSSVRKTHADAIADMALENFVEMRDHVGDPAFLLKKGVEHRLEKDFPGQYRSRYGLVTFSNVPYRVAFELGERSDEVVKELVKGIHSPDEIDLSLAGRLIREKFTPWLEKAL